MAEAYSNFAAVYDALMDNIPMTHGQTICTACLWNMILQAAFWQSLAVEPEI